MPTRAAHNSQNLLFDFDDISVKGGALAAIKKAFARLGTHVVAVESDGKAQRTSGVTYKELNLTMADSQQIVLRIKQTGDIFSVLLNKKPIAIRDQSDLTKAVSEIDGHLSRGRAAFQKKLAKAQVPLPPVMKIASPKLEKQLEQKRDDLKAAIEAVEAEIVEVTNSNAY